MGPLDLRQLATRIETLQRTRTHGWHSADQLEFRNLLPGGRGRQTLPDPARLRELANVTPLEGDDAAWVTRHWRNWVTWAMRAEGLVRDNDPRNPRRIIRDIQQGRFPGRR